MSVYNNFGNAKWTLPGDAGTDQISESLLFTTSPVVILGQQSFQTNVVHLLQVWVKWTGITGGDATSKLQLKVYAWSTYFTPSNSKECSIANVNDTVSTTYTTYDLATGAAPSDSFNYLRAGNFGNNDGRTLRMYAENFKVEVINAGTAYTGGTVNVTPEGWSS